MIHRRTVNMIILPGILLLAIVLRVMGLRFGLPYAESRPDEMTVISKALGYGTGDFNPHYFNYPTLFSYLLFACYAVYAAGLFVLGHIHTAWDFAVMVAGNPEHVVLIARSVSALAGSITVLLLYVLGSRAFGKRAGLAASLFLAVAYLHVRESHFGVTDVTMTCLLTASMIPIVGVLQRGRWRDYIGAGVLVGLAASTKYNAGIGAASLLVAHLMSDRMQGRHFLARLWDVRWIVAVIVMAMAFFLASPFVLLDFFSFVRDFRYEMKHLAGAGELIGNRGWWHHLVVSLWYGVGPVMLGAALLGLVMGCLARSREMFILAVFPVLYYLAIGKGYTVFVRYVLPMIPFICLFAGYAVERLQQWLRIRTTETACMGVSAAVLLGVSAEPLCRSIAFDRFLLRKDTRQEAVEYVRDRSHVSTEIGWAGTRYGRPIFPESEGSLLRSASSETSSRWPGRFAQARREAARDAGRTLMVRNLSAAEQCDIPEIVLVETYPLPWASYATEAVFRALKENGFTCEIVFEGVPANGTGLIFDRQDSFYGPYAGFSRAKCPGPTIAVWRRKK